MKSDMTKGGIRAHLVRFAVPLILGNIFQLTYNAVYSIIVGKFVGNQAQAAIGISAPLMNVIIFFIVGICNGTSVLMSEYFGAGDHRKFRREVSTAMIVGIVFALCIALATCIFVRPVLQLIRTPDEIMDITAGYLRIVCTGLVFTFLYNIYAATLRSIGDARTPIYFLIFSSVLNVALDLVFVVGLKAGVYGAALATVISQGISSVLCMIYIRRFVPLLSIPRGEMTVDRALLKDTIHYSWSTGMQKITLNVGKVLVQSCVNPLGVDTIAAFNAVTRVDDFVFQPEQSIGSAMTTFAAQNRGAGNQERVEKSLKTGMLMEAVYWLFIGTLIYLVSTPVMHLFVSDAENAVVGLGSNYLRTMAFFYLLPAMTNGLQGYIRGWGRMNVCLMATFLQIVGRVTSAYILVPRMGLEGIAYSCLIGWIVMLAYEVPYYLWLRGKLDCRKNL